MFIELLEDFQPHRSQAYGFVTDLIHIQFLRVYRSADRRLACNHSPLYFVKEEISLLHGFATAPLEFLGWTLPLVPEYLQIVRGLGTGASSFVYEARLVEKSETIVIKLPKPSSPSDLGREMETLKLLLENDVPLVPLLDPRSTPQMLLVRPLAIDLNSWMRMEERRRPLILASALAVLTKTLPMIHRLGLVHSDISIYNLLYDQTTETLILNDWGSTVDIGSPARAATLYFVYNKELLNAVQPSLDVVALLLSVQTALWSRIEFKSLQAAASPQKWWREMVGNIDFFAFCFGMPTSDIQYDKIARMASGHWPVLMR